MYKHQFQIHRRFNVWPLHVYLSPLLGQVSDVLTSNISSFVSFSFNRPFPCANHVQLKHKGHFYFVFYFVIIPHVPVTDEVSFFEFLTAVEF